MSPFLPFALYQRPHDLHTFLLSLLPSAPLHVDASARLPRDLVPPTKTNNPRKTKKRTNNQKQLASQFASLTLLEEGKTMDDVRRKLSHDFAPTLKNGLCYWPLVGMLNAAFVPVLSRPAVSSFAGVFWNVYISYQANHNGMEVGELSVVYPLTEAESPRAALRSKIVGAKFASDGGVGGAVSES
ncbi:unnamed protein product, partial [Laminaria digitata]